MTPDLITTAEALADTLAAENAALLAMDFSRATELATAKTAALTALRAARATDALAALDPAQRAEATCLGARLQALVLENRRLLECAIQVQGRVLRSIARAVPAALPHGTRYAANGAMALRRNGLPLSLCARI